MLFIEPVDIIYRPNKRPNTKVINRFDIKTTFSTLIEPPAPISSEPMVIDNGKSHLSLSWGKPFSTGAAPVIAYRVEAWLIGADGGARWNELGVTPITCFDVFNLKPGAQYHFRVTPRNRYGWGHSVQTSHPVTVGAFATLPEFTKILPGQIKVLLGKDFALECVYKGNPRPCIVWYKDEIPLDDNDDRMIVKVLGTSTCRLEIKNVQASDSGRYTCEATNSQGRVSTFARLQAVADYKIYEVDNKLKQRVNSEMVRNTIYASIIWFELKMESFPFDCISIKKKHL